MVCCSINGEVSRNKVGIYRIRTFLGVIVVLSNVSSKIRACKDCTCLTVMAFSVKCGDVMLEQPYAGSHG